METRGTKKKRGRARVCGDTRGKTVQRECKHRLYGCIGETNTKTFHSSERSRYCTFSGKSTEEIEEIREAYFQEHPDARKEYESIYPDGGRKRKGGCYHRTSSQIERVETPPYENHLY